jgi:inner membrane protein YidH
VTDQTPRPDGSADGGGHVDYRFSLANERTVLAYLRTALALDAAALAVARFLTVGPEWMTATLAVLLALAGLGTGVAAIVRFQRVQAAMERGVPLPPARVPGVLAVTLGVCSLLVVVLVLV